MHVCMCEKALLRPGQLASDFWCDVTSRAIRPPYTTILITRTLLVPLIGDIWSPIVGTQALIEGRRRGSRYGDSKKGPIVYGKFPMTKPDRGSGLFRALCFRGVGMPASGGLSSPLSR